MKESYNKEYAEYRTCHNSGNECGGFEYVKVLLCLVRSYNMSDEGH